MSNELEFTEAAQEHIERIARRVAREEISSLSGLVLRRIEDISAETGDVDGELLVSEFAGIFGEALRDFSATESEPGL